MTLIDSKQLNKLWTKSTDLNSPQRARHLYDLAFFLWTNKQFDEAVAVAESAMEELAERVGSSLWIEAMHLKSLVLHDSKRDEEAISASSDALKYGDTLSAPNERAFMHLHLADCYRATEQQDLQEGEYLKAIGAFQETDNKFFLSQAYIDLINLYYRSGRYLESKKYVQLVIPVLEETQSTDRMTFIKYRLSGIERKLGNLQVALVYAEEALHLAKFGRDIVAARENTIELAMVHEALGNYEIALELLDSLVEDNDDSIKNRSAAKAEYYRANIFRMTGNLEQAKIGFRQSIPILKSVDQNELAINAHLAVIHLTTTKGTKND
jgi:tetratricopeptide (TPR) repeat protein